MATALDIRLRAAALRILAKYGQRPVSYLSAAAGAYSTTTDTRTVTFTEKRESARVAPPQIVSEGYMRGVNAQTDPSATMVQMGDAITYMAASGATFTPAVGDRVVFAGADTELWEVIRVRPFIGGEQVAAWEIVLRGITNGTGG